MELLLLLVEAPGDLIPRDMIARRLWQDAGFVDVEASIHTAVMRVRQALGDHRASFVETVPGKGYRFVAPVERVLRKTPDQREAPNAGVHNLPAELTSLVGRQIDIQTVRQLLATSRLVSLTGSGGVGKTRLALRVASELVGEFPDGVWVADFGPVVTPELVAQTICQALGLREGPAHSPREALIDYLRDRDLLLVLDTCEHMVSACAELVEHVLQTAARIRILTTSREALGTAGEVVYRVPSLPLPDDAAPREALLASDVARLFLDRAAALDPTFTPSETDARAIARICRRLDGIPLAIELAATRVTVLSLEQIETRLQDRFRLLTGGARTAVPRQRTLEATVEWSYQLLAEAERIMLTRLSVFPASCTLEAAERVCGGDPVRSDEALDLLGGLVRKSLVTLDRVPGGPRYRLLDTVRDYAAARLAGAGAEPIRLLYFTYFFERYRDSQRVLRGPHQRARLGELRAEEANIRAALEWGFARRECQPQAMELATAMFWYWTKNGLFAEGRRWLERAVRVDDAPPQVRARAIYGLAHMDYFQGDQPRVIACGARVVEIGRTHGDTWAVSVGWFLQALGAFELGDLDRAGAAATAAREAADLCQDSIEHGGPLMVLANVQLVQGHQDEALRLYDESIAVHRQVGDVWGLSILLSVAACLRVLRGDFEIARVHGTEALALCRMLDDPRGVAWSLEVFAGLFAAGGRPEDAARVWGISDGLLKRSGSLLTAGIGAIRERYRESVQNSLGPDTFTRVSTAGRQMAPAEAEAWIDSTCTPAS